MFIKDTMFSGEKEQGILELIVGPMFSGKSDELIGRIRRAPFAKKQAQAFTSIVDTRRGLNTLSTYDLLKHEAVSVKNSVDIISFLQQGTNWVGIDEAQFFDMDLPSVCDQLVRRGLRVIVAGLIADFRGEPFGPMDELLRDADKITKLRACCNVCGEKASRTQRLVNGKPANYTDPVVVVGAAELYEARCREHHEVPGKPAIGG